MFSQNRNNWRVLVNTLCFTLDSLVIVTDNFEFFPLYLVSNLSRILIFLNSELTPPREFSRLLQLTGRWKYGGIMIMLSQVY